MFFLHLKQKERKMSNQTVKNVLAKIEDVYQSIEDELSAWTSPECMPFETLEAALGEKFNWSADDFRRHIPFVRYYIFNHDEWTSIRGAKGGVQRKSIIELKKNKKSSLKEEVAAQIQNAILNSQKNAE